MRHCVMVFFVGVLLVCSVASAGERVIKSFSGNGARNVRPFTVRTPWEVQWHSDGPIFQIYVHTGQGKLIAVAANQQGSGTGSSYQPRGGKYYLQINALGKWKVRVVELPKRVAPKPPAKKNASVLMQASGNGARNTRPFTSAAAWEIKWHAKGSMFQTYVYSSDGKLVGVAANQQGSGKGQSFQPKAGTYYLQVNAIGEWSITIVPVK